MTACCVLCFRSNKYVEYEKLFLSCAVEYIKVYIQNSSFTRSSCASLDCLQASVLFRLFLLFQPQPAFFSLIISLKFLNQLIRILLEYEIECEIGIEKYQLKVGQARESV